MSTSAGDFLGLSRAKSKRINQRSATFSRILLLVLLNEGARNKKDGLHLYFRVFHSVLSFSKNSVLAALWQRINQVISFSNFLTQ